MVQINTFQSHEFGYGMPLCDEQLKEVNKYHEGKYYTHEESAMQSKSLVRKFCSKDTLAEGEKKAL
jgi:hypothetical protein